MKVFISHAFGGEDERLGSILKGDLEAAGMDGYMAERAPKYNRLISDKIRRELDGSDWLVAVLTERGNASASVHEEIGYALGRGTEVALMVKKGVEMDGVLVHGRETMVFAPGEFKRQSLEMAEFIRNTPSSQQPPRLGQSGQDARQLLDERGILSERSANFAQNRYFSRLYNGGMTDVDKPIFMFTACPHELVDYGIVATAEFAAWAEGIVRLDMRGHHVTVRDLYPKIDIGSLTIIERQPNEPPNRDIRSYREFCDNALFEYGTSHSCFTRNRCDEPSLHLCLLIGSFWSFLSHTRLFYQRIGMKGPFTTFISVRNSSKLALGNYGDEMAAGKRRRPQDSSLAHEPHTKRRHIRLPLPFDSAHGMTDRAIADAAREAARKVCNAYGQDTPKCYNADGKFAWDLWECVSR